MDKQKLSLPRITPFINGLEKSNEYLEASGRHDRFRALGRTASVYADKMDEARPETKTDILNQMSVHLMGTLPGFIESSRALDAIEESEEYGERVSPVEKRTHLEAVIPFNHAVRDLVDMFPDFTFEQVQNYCAQMTFEMSNPVDAAYCKQSVREVLSGMRTEIGASEIIWNVEGVKDVVPAKTVEEELKGIDLTVIYRGKSLRLDIKSSEKSVERALNKQHAYRVRSGDTSPDEGGYPVYPKLGYEDFGGGFHISQAKAAELAPRMKRLLDELYEQTYGAAA